MQIDFISSLSLRESGALGPILQLSGPEFGKIAYIAPELTITILNDYIATKMSHKVHFPVLCLRQLPRPGLSFSGVADRRSDWS